MARSQLSGLSANELAKLVATRAVSPRDIIADTIARIGEIEPTINAFSCLGIEGALAAAAAAEAAIMRGDELGRLQGAFLGSPKPHQRRSTRLQWRGSKQLEPSSLAKRRCPKTDGPPVVKVR